MALVEKSLIAGVCFLFSSLFFLSTWPAMFNYCSLWKRNDIHIFLDCASGYVALTVLVALTLGMAGDSPTFLEQISDIGNNWPCVLTSLLGGALLMAGNLSMQIALSMGVSLSVVLPIQSCAFEMISTTLNYFLAPEENDASILFAGLIFFIVAIVTSAGGEIRYKRSFAENGKFLPKGILQRHVEKRMAAKDGAVDSSHPDPEKAMQATPQISTHSRPTTPGSCVAGGTPRHVTGQVSLKFTASSSEPTTPSACVAGGTPHSRCTSREFTESLPKSIEDAGTVSKPDVPEGSGDRVVAGLLVALAGGVSFGFFAPLFNISVNDQFGWLKDDAPPLTGLTANFYFALSFWIFAHVTSIPRMTESNTSLRSYLMDNDHRWLAVASGLFCGLGNTFQFLGGMATSFAVCGVARAFPLISIFWGMALFGEFRQATKGVKALVVIMYIAYLAATTLMMLSIKIDDA
jgi:hypothetical protein